MALKYITMYTDPMLQIYHTLVDNMLRWLYHVISVIIKPGIIHQNAYIGYVKLRINHYKE